MNRTLAVFLTAVLGFGVATFVFAQEAIKANQTKEEVKNTETINNEETNTETNSMTDTVTNAVTNQEAAPAIPATGTNKW
ncbi:MAG: hypothetical protein HY209_07550 [Candidatus Omnitrophica bacterium]|nr:hypothetical protein [Candidatus Omnitrophota bacterium]